MDDIEEFPAELRQKAPGQDAEKHSADSLALQVLRYWRPPPFKIARGMNGKVADAGWRQTGRGGFATTGPFGSELLVYDRYLPRGAGARRCRKRAC